MPKATDELLKDHKMIRKALEGFTLENPRFEEISKTLHRLLLGHAWFEDKIFLPAIEKGPLFAKRFVEEISQEHLDLDTLMQLVQKTPAAEKKTRDAYALQLRTLLETHFRKEEDALFPIAERTLDTEGLNHLTEEMRRRQHEIRFPLPNV